MRALSIFAFVLGASVSLHACPTPQMPKGPPPQYEDPPAPSWLDGGTEGGTGGGDAGPNAPGVTTITPS